MPSFSYLARHSAVVIRAMLGGGDDVEGPSLSSLSEAWSLGCGVACRGVCGEGSGDGANTFLAFNPTRAVWVVAWGKVCVRARAQATSGVGGPRAMGHWCSGADGIERMRRTGAPRGRGRASAGVLQRARAKRAPLALRAP